MHGSGYSLLGFGDVLLPGLVVAFCHRFDLQLHPTHASRIRRNLFFIAALASYTVGLVLTFIALSVSSAAQPALLYLSPRY